ncbi:MAG TPA: hypothetical protein VM840_00845, partial [Actinomycetota bacterium]|nr:hypothetical protein [Actinomycetota bacterium]
PPPPPPGGVAVSHADEDGDAIVGLSDTAGGTSLRVTAAVPLEPGETATLRARLAHAGGAETITAPVTVTASSNRKEMLLDLRSMPDGPGTLTVSGSKSDGEQIGTSRPLTVDRAPPTTTITTGDESSYYSIPFLRLHNVRLDGTVSDAIGVRATAVLFRNNETGTYFGPYLARRSGPPTSQSWTLTGYYLDPGTYTVNAYSFDEPMNLERPGPPPIQITVL